MASKNGILMLLAKKHPVHDAEGSDGDDGAGDDGADGDHPAGLESAAEDLIAAIKSDDPKAVAAALHDAFSMCDGDEE